VEIALESGAIALSGDDFSGGLALAGTDVVVSADGDAVLGPVLAATLSVTADADGDGTGGAVSQGAFSVTRLDAAFSGAPEVAVIAPTTDPRNPGLSPDRAAAFEALDALAITDSLAVSQGAPGPGGVILDEARLVLTRFGNAQATAVPFDESRDVALAQPFYMHFLHRALARAGRQQTIVDNIRQRWGTMIAAGDRTFRESWQIIPLTSLCHAWAGTPTYDLSTEVLGVKPLAPGFRKFRVEPHPAGLTWAKGTFPSPFGEIGVDWRLADGRITLDLIVPEGTEAEVWLPGGDTAVIVGPGNHRLHR
jgi:hypothetical protein